jgi:hypothetical protein
MDLLWRAHATAKPEGTLSRYAVTKVAWRGRYRRVFCVGPFAVATQVYMCIAQLAGSLRGCAAHTDELRAFALSPLPLLLPLPVPLQNPEAGMAITNTYIFSGDSDIESVTLGPGADEFTLTARQDKKASSVPSPA